MSTDAPIGPPTYGYDGLPSRVVAIERGGVTAVFDEVPINLRTADFPLWVRPTSVDLVCPRFDPATVGDGDPLPGTAIYQRGDSTPLLVDRPCAEVVALLWPSLAGSDT